MLHVFFQYMKTKFNQIWKLHFHWTACQSAYDTTLLIDICMFQLHRIFIRPKRISLGFIAAIVALLWNGKTTTAENLVHFRPCVARKKTMWDCDRANKFSEMLLPTKLWLDLMYINKDVSIKKTPTCLNSSVHKTFVLESNKLWGFSLQVLNSITRAKQLGKLNPNSLRITEVTLDYPVFI